MNTIIILPLMIPIIAIEIATRIVYSKLIKEEEINVFLKKHLKEYTINNIAYPKKLFFASNLPYIGQHFSIISKWVIQDQGRISRWSKGSKILDNYWDSLEKPKIKKLSDL